MTHRTVISILFALLSAAVCCQDAKEPVRLYADSRIVNGHSVETSTEGVLKFIIAHRFGRLNSGVQEFFGLDQASMRIGLDYGIWNWLTIGLGRSSFQKTVDGFLKYRIIQASTDQKFPFSITGLSNMTVNTLKFADPERTNYFTSRLAFTNQLLVAAKISERVRMQVMPTLVHRNQVRLNTDKNDVIAIGMAPTFRISKTVVINAEFYYTPPDQLPTVNTNSLAVGVDIETKGHVFQLTLSNSIGLTERYFVTETSGQWENGDIHLGFNIVRDFTIKGRKY